MPSGLGYVCSGIAGEHEPETWRPKRPVGSAGAGPNIYWGILERDCDKERPRDNLFFDKSVVSCEFLKERENADRFSLERIPQIRRRHNRHRQFALRVFEVLSEF